MTIYFYKIDKVYDCISSQVYFLHNRKAGGTAVRMWLGDQQICHNVFVGFVEEGLVFNASRLGLKIFLMHPFTSICKYLNHYTRGAGNSVRYGTAGTSSSNILELSV